MGFFSQYLDMVYVFDQDLWLQPLLFESWLLTSYIPATGITTPRRSCEPATLLATNVTIRDGGLLSSNR